MVFGGVNNHPLLLYRAAQTFYPICISGNKESDTVSVEWGQANEDNMFIFG